MNSPVVEARGGALIVAADREDRRVLFDALDAQAFEEIYSARDIGQARGFLAPELDIDLVLLEFGEDPTEALTFCEELRQHARRDLPVIGILGSRGGSWRDGRLPAGLIEWIARPVKPDDALARIKVALAARSAGTARSQHASGGDRYQFAFDGSLDELAIVDPASGRILEVNATFVQRSGYPRAQILAGRIDGFDLVLSAERREEIARRLERDGSVHVRARKPRADGGSYPVDLHVRLAVQEGRVVHFYLFREIEELSRHQEALVALLRMAQGGSHDHAETALRCLVDWLALDYAAFVEAPAEQAPEPQALAVFRRLEDSEGPDPLREVNLRHVLDGNEILQASGAWRSAGADASVREHRYECVIGLPLYGERQTCLGALMMARREPLVLDAAVIAGMRVVAHSLASELDLRHARAQGRAIGLRDPLTGLPNRLLFNDRLNSAINEAHRTSEMFAVVFVDLDRFKNINDSLGHAVGDQVLAAVAKRLRASVRSSDTVARYAGDEFTLILRHIVQREDVVRIAEKIVRAMEAPLQLAGGLELSMTASLGLSFYPDDATDAERLLKHADVAMYSAKGMGRNNFQAYVAVPEESHQQRLALEAKLRQAERNGELRVFYQPQLDGQTEDIVGMEALIRWEHPELGMISPGFFIPLAEESGLIIPIGEWILRAACRDTRRWQLQHGLPLRIGVNLSPLQLRQPNLVQVVADVLKETGLDPHLLDLEVTESINVKSIPNLLETLHGLRGLGCGISIDDFGTGQSSLDYIKRFPADRIKIDQAFVRNIGVDPDDEAIVRATISMAHNLNREVVAEGVEIEQHLDFLRAEGCEVLQGFLFCRPLPAASFEALLQERARLLGRVAAPVARA
ncbi:EAL domain-containing protein [Dokdonella fugitiva]|jgi:diguanylate cyclase (GGDEF)-like protein/PAS domain S-box-containing protein|uniref:cyclic-guanylate-specific phosphodiesterase n=1 Tax=Dokdonella fugitiva TaxID=328517 RepID=A0A4R2I9K1_9GAMM|nr:EAL domain-containing protein [Dokdonella fugitiva]MBA8883224.1 diguanylate cyclase (GGDEF)-like protein/PAS domain S-box-containing protein [Dokdonella fugitiva]TCO40319.1 PAS domain S-box-containing protein/diguanylate cyclase (GGDEF)-like protein [Dokdonella fugitiva]